MADKFAIITGASTGIGYELAKLAAQDGYDLLVVADEPLIDSAAHQFEALGVKVDSIEADLSTIQGVDLLLNAANGRQVDVLCANAGRGLGYGFLDQDVQQWRHVVDTNITGTVYLLQRVLRQMTVRDAGKVLITGSIAGFIPGSFNAVYNGTKAFVDSFSEALRNELKDSKGVTITTLLPGATETEFFERAGMEDTKVGVADKAEATKVAQDGWTALMSGKARITSGWSNKLQVAASGILPQSVLAQQHRDMAEPGSASN